MREINRYMGNQRAKKANMRGSKARVTNNTETKSKGESKRANEGQKKGQKKMSGITGKMLCAQRTNLTTTTTEQMTLKRYLYRQR